MFWIVCVGVLRSLRRFCRDVCPSALPGSASSMDQDHGFYGAVHQSFLETGRKIRQPCFPSLFAANCGHTPRRNICLHDVTFSKSRADEGGIRSGGNINSPFVHSLISRIRGALMSDHGVRLFKRDIPAHLCRGRRSTLSCESDSMSDLPLEADRPHRRLRLLRTSVGIL